MLMEYRRGRITQEYRRWGRLARLLRFRVGATHVTPDDDSLRVGRPNDLHSDYAMRLVGSAQAHRNGLAVWLNCLMYRIGFRRRSVTQVNTPRAMTSRSI